MKKTTKTVKTMSDNKVREQQSITAMTDDSLNNSDSCIPKSNYSEWCSQLPPNGSSEIKNSNWESYTEGRRRRKMATDFIIAPPTSLFSSSSRQAFVLPVTSSNFLKSFTSVIKAPLVNLLYLCIVCCFLLNAAHAGPAKLSSDIIQKFANQPSPQTAVIGSTVVLPCRVINKVGELQWTRDDFGLGNERELIAFKRYKMIGSHEEGDYSLQISNVRLEDDAYFQCQVLGVGPVMGVRSRSAKLTVYVPPDRPEIKQGPVVKTKAGAGVQIDCVSKGGKPEAEIQWLDGASREIKDGVVYTTESSEDNHRIDAKSTLSFVATREHHDTDLTCTASNPAINQPLSTKVRLEVSYPPEVSITHDKKGYKENETAVLTCHASANPAQLTFRWRRGGTVVSNDNSTQLRIENVTRDSNSEEITCEVSNSVGTSKQTTRLSVHYGPSFITEPEDVYADPGENVTLRCDIDANPHATIVWVGQEEKTVVGREQTLNIEASAASVGKYQCIAKVQGFPEITGTFGIFLKGPPTVEAETVQWGHTGDTVTLHCLITAASPRSVTVTWSKYGSKVDFEPGHFEEEEKITPHGLRHSLIIHNAKSDDFGTYNCSVQNAYGSGMVQIILNKKKSLPILFLSAGVGLSILFVIAVAAFVVFFGRRSAAKQKAIKTNGGFPEKTVTLQLGDQSSNGNDSDLKVELENRTGSSLSNVKDPAELDSWDKDGGSNSGSGNGTLISGGGRALPPIVSSPNNAPTPPSYHLTTSQPSYLYPEGFSRMSMKQNGHVLSNGGALTYSNYADHNMTVPKPGVITSGFSSVGLTSGYSTAGPTYSQGPLVTSSQHNLFPNYGDYDVTRENPEGSPTFPHNYPNGYNNQSLGCSTLPLGLHLTSRNNAMNTNNNVGVSGGPAPPVPNPPTSVSIADHMNASPSSTIPRLGIPVDPSQYIMPPRTQVMQGALATHV